MSTLKVDSVVEKTSGHGVHIPGHVMQVVQGTTSTNVTNNSTTYIDSGLSVNITPLSSSSKILVMAKQKGVRLDHAEAQVLTRGLPQ